MKQEELLLQENWEKEKCCRKKDKHVNCWEYLYFLKKNRSGLVIVCGRNQDGALQRQLSSHVCDAAKETMVSKFPRNFLIKKTGDVLQGSAEQNLRCFKNYNVSWLKHLFHSSSRRQRRAHYHQLKKRRLRNRRRTSFCFCAWIVSKVFLFGQHWNDRIVCGP